MIFFYYKLDEENCMFKKIKILIWKCSVCSFTAESNLQYFNDSLKK